MSLISLESTPLTEFAVKVSGTNASGFTQTNKCGSQIEAKGKCVLTVTFKPPTVGKFTADLDISYSVGGSAQSQSVGLEGTGKVPTATATLTLSSKALAFGPQRKGTTSGNEIVGVENLGTAVLTGFAANIVGTNAKSFSATSTCGSNIPARGKCTLTANFTPTEAGTFTAAVSVTYSVGTVKHTQSLSLEGTASE